MLPGGGLRSASEGPAQRSHVPRVLVVLAHPLEVGPLVEAQELGRRRVARRSEANEDLVRELTSLPGIGERRRECRAEHLDRLLRRGDGRPEHAQGPGALRRRRRKVEGKAPTAGIQTVPSRDLKSLLPCWMTCSLAKNFWIPCALVHTSTKSDSVGCETPSGR